MTVTEVIGRLEDIAEVTNGDCASCNLVQTLVEDLTRELEGLLQRRRES